MNADLISRAFPALPDRLSPEDWQDVADVLDAAAEWDAGRLPLESFARIGTIANPATGRSSPGYTRHVAVRVTHRDDPRRAPLLRVFDALLRFEGWIVTDNGVFAPADIIDIPVVVRRAA